MSVGSLETGRPARHLGWWTAWHALVGAGIALAASHLQLAAPIWALPPQHRVLIVGVGAAYAVAAGVALWRAPQPIAVRVRGLLLAIGIGFGGLCFAIVLTGAPASRLVLLGALAAAVVANTVMLVPLPRGLVASLVVIAVIAVAGLVQRGMTLTALTQRRPLATIFYDVDLLTTERAVPSPVMGGGVVPLNGGVLIATGDGRMHFADVSSPSAINVRTLPYRIPLNFDEFSRDTDARTAKHSFRVADIDIEEQAGTLRLLASHHYWDRDRRCFVLRISTATTSSDSLLAGTADLRWRTAFETQPCMLLKSDPTQTPFNGDETGGRMLRLDDGSLLLTVGDVAHDGWNSKVTVAQNPDSHWGKILRINLADGSSELYTVGHRNPQGLVRGLDGRIWATEHGPKGGDELNRIERGSNYGWPRVTLGVDYEQHKWPLSATQGRHAGYPGPVYAWLPSIGVSSLIALQGDAFAEWRGDLLVASLGAGTLYRVRLDGDRVQFAEPMSIGGRIRDLTELPDGRVFMLLDSGDLKAMAPIPEPEEGETSVFFTPVMRGELLFAGCANCHAGDDRGTAPSLAGVAGRTVAAASGYDYSPALRALGGQWSADRIDAFLADPSGYVPGTTMRTAAMRDPVDRRSLIAYLESLR